MRANHNTSYMSYTKVGKCGLLSLLLLVFTLGSQAEPQGQPLGLFTTNSHKVIISQGDDAPLYTVYDLQGNLLAKEISRAQLAERMPQIDRLMQKGVAKDASLEKPANRLKLEQQ